MSSSVISANGLAGRARARVLRLLLELLEDPRQLAAGLLDAQAHEAERAAVVEDHDQDDALGDQRHVEVVALALVEVDREVFLADDLREAAGRGDAAGGERGEARGVDAAHLAGLGDQLAVLVDDEDALRVGVADQSLDDAEDLSVVLVVHHELGVPHRQVPL